MVKSSKLYEDNYKNLSGWIHDFYCDKDGSELLFDKLNDNYFECPLCHIRYNDIRRKRAWITKYRYDVFSSLVVKAQSFLETKEQKYIKEIEKILNYYSINYEQFDIHDKDGNTYNSILNESNKCGKITSQGLNEAMIAIDVAKTINLIEEFLNEETKQNVYEKFFVGIYNLLKPQITKFNNIACYEICSLAIIGIICKNEEILAFAFNSPYSFFKQLDNCLTIDNIWFEGSFHYHFFILKPILEVLKYSKIYSYKIEEKYLSKVKLMLINAYKASFSDCTLPSPNDGWPNRSLNFYLNVYELGNYIFPHEFDKIINNILKKENDSRSINYLDTGFSLLKNKYWNVFIKYKDNNKNHAHPDKLNIEIKLENEFLTHDLSTSGYGSLISKSYYKKTYSHNTIVINCEDQSLDTSYHINSLSDKTIDVKVDNIYLNSKANRKIILNDNNLFDELKVTTNQPVDYFFHSDALLISSLNLKAVNKIEKYSHLTNINKVISELPEIHMEWILNNRHLVSKIDLRDSELFICNSPDNPDIKKRTTLLIHNNSQNKDKIFKIEWTLKEK